MSLLLAGDLKGPDAPSVELSGDAPDAKADGGGLTGKLTAGAATVGAAVGYVFGKGGGKADAEVRR